MRNRSITALLVVAMMASGCAHTTANPVLVAQAGDDAKSCDAITNEMQLMIQAQATAASDRNKQIAGNVALGVTGAFLLVPLFFMDTGNAATVEERAAQARYQRLNQMQIDKKCPASPIAGPIAAADPPLSTASASASALAPASPSNAARPVAAPIPVATPATIALTPVASTAEAPKVASAISPLTTGVASKTGQSSFTVEHLPDVRACASQPQAVLTAKGPGFESYTVACSDGNALAVRCDSGNCRVLR